MGRRVIPHVLVAWALVLVAGFAAAPGATVAQDAGATPTAGEMRAHPAHIHSGTCETLGGIVFPLNDLTESGTRGTPQAGMAATPMAGVDMGQVVAWSTTTVEASLDDILAAEHAINVHESAENIENYIACGDLTGTPEGDQLEIELQQLNNSGFEGRATLRDNGDGSTTVDVVLMQAGGMATPQATPTG